MSLFPIGQIVSTPGALAFCEQHKINPMLLLDRHAGGDFGDLDEHDAKANTAAIQEDTRIFSSYKFGKEKLWVITEADRSSTCLLLPDEY